MSDVPKTTPVGAALAAATEAARRSLYPGMCRDGACMSAPCQCAHDAAAAAIIAFLRALPDQYSRGGAAFWDAIPAEDETRLWLAGAVEGFARHV